MLLRLVSTQSEPVMLRFIPQYSSNTGMLLGYDVEYMYHTYFVAKSAIWELDIQTPYYLAILPFYSLQDVAEKIVELFSPTNKDRNFVTECYDSNIKHYDIRFVYGNENNFARIDAMYNDAILFSYYYSNMTHSIYRKKSLETLGSLFDCDNWELSVKLLEERVKQDSNRELRISKDGSLIYHTYHKLS